MRPKLIWLTLFAMTMAYLESAVVIYLRGIYYPEGFAFPLKSIPTSMFLIEIGREAATLLMLASIAILVGKTRDERWAVFMFTFGIWDIFYYIWLKLCIDWPPSLLTRDVLFLIPIPWIGPVLAPVLVSLTLIMTSTILLYYQTKGYRFTPTTGEWAAGITAGLFIFVSFITETKKVLAFESPASYLWSILIVGELVGIITFIRLLHRTTLSTPFRKDSP